MPLRIENALPAFEEYDQSRGLAAGTVRRHLMVVRRFARTCDAVKGSGATMGQVDHQCVSRFFAELGGSTGHRNNALESLKAFLSWAEKFGYLRPGFTTAKLLEGYKSRVPERQPKYYLTAQEFPVALAAAGERNPIDRAVLAIAIYTLARQSEISGLRLCDYDEGNRTLRIYRPKRQRWTETGVTPELAAELRGWLSQYARLTGYLSPVTMIREHPDWHLVPSRQSWRTPKTGVKGFKPLPEQPIGAMERVAKRALNDLGVQGTRTGKSRDHLGEGMHTIRRSGARAMLKNLSEQYGHDRALVQVCIMLDHQDTKMTLKYIGMDLEKTELNDWLRGHSMYGTPPEAPEAAVIPIRALA
jgi:integrase